MMELDLPLIWAGLISFAVLVYVILDGFDLGVGILFPFVAEEGARDQAMSSVAPVWDGNETWLVLGGGGLFAVFPLAYAVVMPALYMPIILMLLALVLRGVSFEFRWRSQRKRAWDVVFFSGSLVAALCQGIALGALVVGYALLGACWLVLKTEDDLRNRMRRYARGLGVTTLSLIGLISILTPLLHPIYFGRWFVFPAVFYSGVVPLLLLILTWTFFKGLNEGRDRQPFFSALGFFVVSFIGIGISFYPMMVPPRLTIAEAAAPDASLTFALVGAVVLLPVMLGYTAYAYWVFRGKLDPDETYY